MPNINDAIDNDEVKDEALDQTVETTEQETEDEAPAARKPISLDDALAKAFEKHTKKDDSEAADPAVKTKGPLPNTPAVEQKPGKTIDPITGREVEPIKAPAGWTPVLREKWGSIDPVVQKFIHDRERDIAQTMSKTAEERKVASEFRDIVAPYEASLRGFGVSASKMTKDLFVQWHALQTGTPEQKAVMIDQFIRFFKPDINTLINLSQGQQPQATQAPAPLNVDQLVEQKLAARDEAAQQAAIGSDIAKFSSDPTNEYFEDVKVQMGRILNAELVDAPTMPELLKKAYDLACSQHPEISQIIAARKAAVVPAAPAAPKAKPVGQVKPSLGNGAKGKAPAKKMSLDDAVNAAFAQHASQ